MNYALRFLLFTAFREKSFYGLYISEVCLPLAPFLSLFPFLYFFSLMLFFFLSSPQSIKINEESMVPVYHLIVIKMNLLRGSPSAIRSRVGHPKQSTGSESEREGENCCHQRKKTSIYSFFPLIGN